MPKASSIELYLATSEKDGYTCYAARAVFRPKQKDYSAKYKDGPPQIELGVAALSEILESLGWPLSVRIFVVEPALLIALADPEGSDLPRELVARYAGARERHVVTLILSPGMPHWSDPMREMAASAYNQVLNARISEAAMESPGLAKLFGIDPKGES